MKTVKTSFRRSFKPAGSDEKQYYGNAEEKVESGPNKDKVFPCIEITCPMIPDASNGGEAWLQEVYQVIGGPQNLQVFSDDIFTNKFVAAAKSVFTGLKADAEDSEEKRAALVAKAVAKAANYTPALEYSEKVTSSEVVDDLTSPEMQRLAQEDPARYAAIALQKMLSARK